MGAGEPLDVVVAGAATAPIPKKLITTIWKAGSTHFAGGSEKFSEPTKPVEAWPQSWKGLFSRILKGQKLPWREDKREHPHLGLYHSPEGFRSNREGDVVLRTGLHVDIDEGATEETSQRLIDALRSWGLAAIVQRRDVVEPYQRKLRAIIPLVPDERRESFYSRAAAFLIGLSDTIACPIDLSPAVWSQPTFIYGPVVGREKPRVIAMLEGDALDLGGVEGTAWGRRVGGEDCPEAMELCRTMFLAAGSVFRGHRGTRPPDGDNPSSIELMPDGEFRCWTQPTWQVRAWLRMNVPDEFDRWWNHPGRRTERARSTLRTREARVASSHAQIEDLESLVRDALAKGGQHVFELPRGIDATELGLDDERLILGRRNAVETLALTTEQMDALRRTVAESRAREAAKQRRVRTFFEYIVEDLFFAGHLHTIPEWTLPDRDEEESIEAALARLASTAPEESSEIPDHLQEVVDGAMRRTAEDDFDSVDAERMVRRLFELAGTLEASRDDETLRVVCIPEWTQRSFVMLSDAPDPALEHVCPEARWVRIEGRDACQVERAWYVTAPVDEDEPPGAWWVQEIEPLLKAAANPIICVRSDEARTRLGEHGYDGATICAADIGRSLRDHDLLIILGAPLAPGWHPEADTTTDAPRDPGFWRAMERLVECNVRALEDSMAVRERADAVRIWYFGPSFPSPPWRETQCQIVAS